MLKLGIDTNKNLKKPLTICCTLIVIVYLFMMLSTYFIFMRIIESSQQTWFTTSYIVSNTYSTLFLIAFCLVLLAIYRRFLMINECLR